MQLLQITTTPMKYRLEIEPARLEYNQDFTPSADVQTKSAKLNIDSIKNIEVKINTYEARKSLGLLNTADMVEQNAQDGKDHLTDKIREYVQIGKEMGSIQNGTSIGQIYRQKDIQQSQLYTAYLPSTGADLSWNPAQLDMSYEKGETNINWQINDNRFNYIPGSVQMKIAEYPDIDIEYLGGPMYVPPSASPDFKESAEA